MKPGWTIKTLNPFMGNVSCQSTTRDLKWRQSFRSDVADPAANVPVRFLLVFTDELLLPTANVPPV
jgi:hypothetical protein